MIGFILLSPFLAEQSHSKELMEMGEPNLRKQEQITMQTERSLVELEERERDIRQLEVRIDIVPNPKNRKRFVLLTDGYFWRLMYKAYVTKQPSVKKRIVSFYRNRAITDETRLFLY